AQRAELAICERLDEGGRPARWLGLGLCVGEGQRLLAPAVGCPLGGCDPKTRRARVDEVPRHVASQSQQQDDDQQANTAAAGLIAQRTHPGRLPLKGHSISRPFNGPRKEAPAWELWARADGGRKDPAAWLLPRRGRRFPDRQAGA